MKTTGTHEWCDSNVNCYYGCSRNCRYCYARHMAIRFKRIEKHEDWADWSAYIDAVEGKNHDEEFMEVAANGSKLNYQIAKFLFPSLDINYTWRE